MCVCVAIEVECLKCMRERMKAKERERLWLFWSHVSKVATRGNPREREGRQRKRCWLCQTFVDMWENESEDISGLCVCMCVIEWREDVMK